MARPAPRPGRRTRGRIVTPHRSRLPAIAFGLVAAAAVVVAVLVWQQRGSGAEPGSPPSIATLPTDDIHAVVWHPTELNTVYAGHHGGVLRSVDGGQTWQATALRDADAMSLAAAPAAPGRMYAAGHGIFRRSDDGGTSWTAPASSIQGADIHGFAQDPVNPDRLYALVVGQGLLLSTDGGATWVQRAPAPPGHAALAVSADGTTVWQAVGNRVQQSTDQGATWTTAGTDLPAGVQVLGLASVPASEALFAATDAGLYRRAGPAAPWEVTPLRQSIATVALSPQQVTRVLAISEHKQVFRSDDGGVTWNGATQ